MGPEYLKVFQHSLFLSVPQAGEATASSSPFIVSWFLRSLDLGRAAFALG
jgi:hypothetical protein